VTFLRSIAQVMGLASEHVSFDRRDLRRVPGQELRHPGRQRLDRRGVVLLRLLACDERRQRSQS
jgi:hypothetical protein